MQHNRQHLLSFILRIQINTNNNGEAKKLLKCTCGCLDFDIEKVKWRAPPLQQAAVQNEDWVEYEATKLTPEFYTSRIAELKPFVGQKGKIEMHGSNSGFPGAVLKSIIEEKSNYEYLYDRVIRGDTLQTSILGIMHLILLGHGKAGILTQLYHFHIEISELIKKKTLLLANLNIKWLRAIRGSEPRGSYAIFQADEVLSIFYFWGFIHAPDTTRCCGEEIGVHEVIRQMCFTLTAIYSATYDASENEPFFNEREEMSKHFLAQFENLFDHGRKIPSDPGRVRTRDVQPTAPKDTGAFMFNHARENTVVKETAAAKVIQKWCRGIDWNHEEQNRNADEMSIDGHHYETFLKKVRSRLLKERDGSWKQFYKFFVMARPNMLNLIAAAFDYRYIEGNDRVFEGFIRRVKVWAKSANTGSKDWPKHVTDKFHMMQALHMLDSSYDIDDESAEDKQKRLHYGGGKQYCKNNDDDSFLSAFFHCEEQKFYAKFDNDGFKQIVPVRIHNREYSFNLGPDFPVINSPTATNPPNPGMKNVDGIIPCIFIRTWENNYVCVSRRLKLLKIPSNNVGYLHFVPFFKGMGEFA